jgi:transcriptional regulator with XRE-family HTH domain
VTFGEIIKKLRIENQYTQSELAEKLGLKLSTMQKYESGAILNVKLETIRKLCEIFEIPTSLLIFPENVVIPLNEKMKIKEVYNVNQMIDCNRLFLSFNDTGRKKSIEYMTDLYDTGKYVYQSSTAKTP